ncbi:NADH-quinone oxidoreductase subunit M [Merismopedia glauca]|uniref:NAD(P)H-quinone oxidoreductase subunit D4 n=1 Tax=Merismopedia glauca CCAP 1448/3 TaxID=1296344 RepID=A0A2T1C883_9CYAN|nr:NADH-quinone oxidoreductase subunit M [Merismopedia glauca]PSB04470.1 NAD(P)H-quinone oxidoreductase subunit D4 [Merismopedia glauca CCAP 1448/3]
MLSSLIWIPIIGALAIGLLPASFSASKVRQFALAIAIAISLISLALLTQFDPTSSQFQLVEDLPWIPQLGLSYKLAVDGLSLPLLLLSNLLTAIVIYSAKPDLQRPRLYNAMILLVNAGIIGAFVAQNLLLFVIFYELELIPLYLLIAIWGGNKRGYAAMKFLIYTAVSGILILAGFLGTAWLSESGSFDYQDISTTALPQLTQLVLLTVLLIGFGIKIPIVPLHTWLPDAYVEASPPVAILLGGVIAKLGTYGLVRFGLQLFPETWSLVAPGIATIGTISVLYGALTAIAQKDIKRMVAYSSIAHMGYVLLGAAALTPLATIGIVAQMVSHGIILALLFYLVGVIEDKAGTRDLDVLNGLLNPVRGLPLTSALLILGGMASAGIPGMMGFVAEFLVFQGSFASFPVQTILCILGSGLTAVYFAILLNRTCFGKLDNKLAYYPKVLRSEQLPALLMGVTILILGIQPMWMLYWSEATTNAISNSVPSQLTAIASQIALNR